MNEIFTVWIKATHYRDENGWKEPLALEDNSWIDSYWTDENKAIEAAQKFGKTTRLTNLLSHWLCLAESWTSPAME